MTAPVTQLRTRKPTGKPGWPRILISGAEGAWKSGTAAMLSADERMGEMFWLEVGDGETTADEYGALPGVRYTILEHDGTWLDIYNQLCGAWTVAKAAEEAGEPPIPLAIDAMSGIHSMLMELGDTRARKKAAKQLSDRNKSAAIAWSADYEASMTPDLWNLIRKRNNQLMTKVLTWPGPVALISRERMATVFENGNPTTQKDWTLECRKDLPSQVTAWVRTEGGGIARVLKLRSAREAVAVNVGERGHRVSDFKLSTLIFDWVGCEVGVSRAASVVTLNADQDMPDEVDHVRSSDQAPPPRDRQGGQREAGGGQREAANRAPIPRAQQIEKAVQHLLSAEDVDKAGVRQAWAMQLPIKDVDVSGLLTDKDRDELSVGAKEAVTLAQLTDLVCAYVGGNRQAVRRVAAPAAAPAAEEPPAEEPPTEEEPAGSMGDALATALASRIAAAEPSHAEADAYGGGDSYGPAEEPAA